jgi:hypothetical protein
MLKFPTLPLFCLASVSACALSPDVDVDEHGAVDVTAQQASNDLSAKYVGRYGPRAGAPSAFRALALGTDGRFTLEHHEGAAEVGTYRVLASSTGIRLRLTRSEGTQIYVVSLGEGDHPLLTMTRAGRTSVLERAPLRCEAIQCPTGQTCSVEHTEAIPTPICKSPPAPPPSAWKARYSGAPHWGVRFEDAARAGNFARRQTLNCMITPATDEISCSSLPNSYDHIVIKVRIQPDGSFAGGGVVPRQTSSELRGRVWPDGRVTVDFFQNTACFTTSSTWCDTRKTEGRVGPVEPYPICRTRDQHFPSGGWASGYWTACTNCRGDCENGT